ncbi:hypothetical protein B0T09DRAFT_85804 [Sordaria sp. MPI-SDFR-AT-0083]|nr:hypothetical protein B0T09DRAFT_85804 [Sordaria sp. MPI-SDFR-AT-0083]
MITFVVQPLGTTQQHRENQLMGATSGVLLLWCFIIVVAVEPTRVSQLSAAVYTILVRLLCLHIYMSRSPLRAKSTQKPQPKRLAPARSFSLALAPYR